MFFKRAEQRTMHPYVAITIGTLAMIGAFSVVKCTKRAVRRVRDKVTSLVKDDGCEAYE